MSWGTFWLQSCGGIQVNEFSVGMGPALWHKVYHGTQYSLRALPVGGFVALEGEESPESQQAEKETDLEPQIPPEQRTGLPLNQAPIWQRMIVMSAGAVMNFVLGFVVLAVLIAAQNEPITSRVVYEIEPGALCGRLVCCPGTRSWSERPALFCGQRYPL